MAAQSESRLSIFLRFLRFGALASIFDEGPKAGLLTFGGAYTVIPFLQDGAVDGITG